MLELPVSEIDFWKAYYSIYPFPQEREDMRTAEIVSALLNVSGAMKRAVNPIELLPDYLGIKSKSFTANKSLEQQKKEFASFKAAYLSATGQNQP